MERLKYDRFSSAILSWFEENGRQLPWRETRDAYAIWLSEVILQQTRVAQGWEYWERFMHEFPTVDRLAAASEDEVLRLWQGLGYYSRARHLHAAARQIVEMGKFPDTLQEIKSLQGVGDYTAAAIASFAFGIPAAVVDGNVYRVLARYFGIATPIDSTQGKKEFAALAQSLLPVSASAAYNQGLMDFGAILCTPQSPHCQQCPLAETCEALRSARVGELPVKRKAQKATERHIAYVYIRCKGFTALHRRGEGDIWQGLWEPFNASLEVTPEASQSQKKAVESQKKAVESLDKNNSPSAVEISARLRLSSSDRLRLVAKGVRHVLTHRILLADFFLLETDRRPPLPEGYIWVREEDVDQYGIPRLVEILLEKVKS